MQPALFADPEQPQGLRYEPGFLSEAEERDLLDRMEALPFKPFQFQQYEGLRRVVSFGWRYDYGERALRSAEPLPPFLTGLRDRAAAFAELPPGEFEHALITEYRPGAPIGWHRDRPEFGEVVGISLLSATRLRFRRREETGWKRFALTVQPRSAYVLAGAARREWEHSIPPVEALRYSVTFRRNRPA